MSRDQAIKELGLRIIKELDDRDITAKWMAAYLSELMVSSEEDTTSKEEIVDLILKLWRERRHYPGGDLMQRYERALAAMELILSNGDPIFQVRMPYKAPIEHDEDKISLAKRLKHHTGSLAAVLVKATVKELDLDQEQLAEIADIVDPDAETRFLNVLRIVVYEEEDEKDKNDPHSEVQEAISDLRLALDQLETVLRGEAKEPKRIN